jgi:hypothetical protein
MDTSEKFNANESKPNNTRISTDGIRIMRRNHCRKHCGFVADDVRRIRR